MESNNINAETSLFAADCLLMTWEAWDMVKPYFTKTSEIV